jgi:hypothetical protein
MADVWPSIFMHATTVNPPKPYESLSFVLPIPKPGCISLPTGSFFVLGYPFFFSRYSTILYITLLQSLEISASIW